MSTSANINKENHFTDLSLLSCYSADWAGLKNHTGRPFSFTLPVTYAIISSYEATAKLRGSLFQW
jgi:hypothetical protein